LFFFWFFVSILTMLAVIKTGGKQYLVSPGQKLKIEKLAAPEGDTFSFEEILLVEDGGNTEIGNPLVKDAKVEAKILRQARARKITILRYHNKTRHRRKKGHRQYFTEVEITKIIK